MKENWIVLGHATYAYFGGFAQMARIDAGEASKIKEGEGRGATKNLPGGGTQFYIPNLRPQDLSSWTVEPLL